jgi:hypothetical protein
MNEKQSYQQVSTESACRGLSLTMPMMMDLNFEEEDGCWRIRRLQTETRGTMFTHVQASEGNTIHHACLILYCWYNLELLQWWHR